MKKKILFILNTYDFMVSSRLKNKSIKEIYNHVSKQNSYWINEFCQKLKKNYKVYIDFPRINSKYDLKKSYDKIIEDKIYHFKPDLVYCNFLDLKIEKILSKLKDPKKIIWLSIKIDEKKMIHLKSSYDYIISGNQNILKLAKQINFKSLELMISSPSYKKFSKMNYLRRKKNIYFSGSLGNDFKYRLKVLEFINKNFLTKFRIRNLVERYYLVQLLSHKLLIMFPNLINHFYKKKIFPIFNSLKFSNSNEIFGKKLLIDMEKYQIVVNVHSGFDQNNNINSRVFETLSCGCLLFCEENKFMKKKFIDNKHVVYFKSLENLKNKLEFFQKNQDQAFKIAKTGNLYFNKYHNSSYRFKDFEKIVKKII